MTDLTLNFYFTTEKLFDYLQQYLSNPHLRHTTKQVSQHQTTSNMVCKPVEGHEKIPDGVTSGDSGRTNSMADTVHSVIVINTEAGRTISLVVNISGDYIAAKSTTALTISDSTTREWSVWRRCLRQVWAPSLSLYFHTSFSKWSSSGHQKWYWFTGETYIYQEIHHRCWRRFALRSNSVYTRQHRFSHDGTMLCREPPSLVRTTVQVVNEYEVFGEGYFGMTLSAEQELVTAIDDTIRLLPLSLKQMLKSSNWKDDDSLFADAIIHSTAICVVDGSFHPEYRIGTASWVIDSGYEEILATGCSRAVGDPAYMCSYCAELFGIYLALQTTLLVCKHLGINNGSI